MIFNINDHVRVRLTDKGLAIADQNGYSATARTVDGDGYSRWQLWVLMSCFGPELYIGAHPPFEGSNIKVDCPASDPDMHHRQ